MADYANMDLEQLRSLAEKRTQTLFDKVRAPPDVVEEPVPEPPEPPPPMPSTKTMSMDEARTSAVRLGQEKLP